MQGNAWHGRKRPRRRFERFRWDRLALVILSAGLIVFGSVRLTGYFRDWASARKTAEALRQVYEAASVVSDDSAPVPTAPPATAVSSTPQPSAAPTAAPPAYLTALKYPDNPQAQASPLFKALRRENKDIVGWLKIDGLLDEAVTQRDETYYMNHDALGKSNANGSIFLDSGISLKTRPYSLVLYGHNMKSGAMFGSLRNYEAVSFYQKNPYITFNTMFEDGRYVVFAAGLVSLERNAWHYMDFFALNSNSLRERQAVLDTLKKVSLFNSPVAVQPDDQLLLLVTCVDKDTERRVVAARRIRPGENEELLKAEIAQSRKR